MSWERSKDMENAFARMNQTRAKHRQMMANREPLSRHIKMQMEQELDEAAGHLGISSQQLVEEMKNLIRFKEVFTLACGEGWDWQTAAREWNIRNQDAATHADKMIDRTRRAVSMIRPSQIFLNPDQKWLERIDKKPTRKGRGGPRPGKTKRERQAASRQWQNATINFLNSLMIEAEEVDKKNNPER
ncbi:MAG: hypothetical protein UX87_C0036G0011 [Candidatus Amesbacteria bacterium GW2011_GWA1_47_16]|uniref:Uncharacterized protein n=3 Tax=Candidatus Amesiibacteriota TaxID=1752730 RepID=A0A0G1X3B4_9BACT|nr:MAG: hypothetical protein UX87_C0036G0011 [Candidatus Amesbacteria bacterium GW2011_GWA1_47_16]KKU97073.1 MAG: hypothetical protein UY28_C0027G0001 [Candidatus Amesbacteria bacterium GW2011_GWB1_48_13]OGD00012.1 MAG: hypothetical protein A2701_00135 [Candidatus Amesbacteria bacterium RIFCSPHIGHO2_01_FULL_47_34]OGD01577.1 MAG: hypothetical protein A2972_00335 [Candidatus Amesbacteria bacterium RIFCSPLOWO2_01_FULL_47_33]